MADSSKVQVSWDCCSSWVLCVLCMHTRSCPAHRLRLILPQRCWSCMSTPRHAHRATYFACPACYPQFIATLRDLHRTLEKCWVASDWLRMQRLDLAPSAQLDARRDWPAAKQASETSLDSLDSWYVCMHVLFTYISRTQSHIAWFEQRSPHGHEKVPRHGSWE